METLPALHGTPPLKVFNHFNTMLDLKSNVKTLKIISGHKLNRHLSFKCILKGVMARNVISTQMSSCFQIIKQLINIYSRYRKFLICFFKSKVSEKS